MALIRPRLTDHYDIPIAQADCDFAIPLLDEDIPLFVDPFLLWKSPSMQDNALHTALIRSFDLLLRRYASGDRDTAVGVLVELSECQEAGLGSSARRVGSRISRELASEALSGLSSVPQIVQGSIHHVEVLQLLFDGIGRDRISDITCSLLKSFLIDYTIEQSLRHGIPVEAATLGSVFHYPTVSLRSEVVQLPVSPANSRPILLIPKRWLRYSPWISYDSYFDGGFVKTDDAPTERVSVLLYNRAHYGLVQQFVAQREAMASECAPDPLFRPISVTSAKRRLKRLKKLPSGNKDAVDKEYEALVASLLTSVLYPQLDFASEQVRTDSGAQIRDLIFYNSRTWDFLQDIHTLYASRQLVFELKNVATLEREHVNQINRYLSDQIGRFGVLITRVPPPRNIEHNLVDLWSGQRRCVLVLSDDDLELMVTLFESRQRLPIEVLKRAYVNFTRLLPS